MNEIIRKIDDLIFEAHRQWTDSKEDRKHCSWDDYSMFIREVVEDKLKEIIQAEQKEPTEEDLKERYYQAREIIKEFCQLEDCQEDCEECPYPLSAIRCGEEWEFKKNKPKTNGDLIREMNNGDLANWIFEKIESTEWDEDGNNNCEDDIAEWLDEVVSERN